MDLLLMTAGRGFTSLSIQQRFDLPQEFVRGARRSRINSGEAGLVLLHVFDDVIENVFMVFVKPKSPKG